MYVESQDSIRRHFRDRTVPIRPRGVQSRDPSGWRFATKVVDFAGEPGMAVAWAQLIFNLVMTLAVLILLRIFQRRVELFDSTAATLTISR